MSERETETPDGSASTAEFRAFASRAGAEAEQRPWSMRAPGRRVAYLVGAVIVVAVVLAIIAMAVASH